MGPPLSTVRPCERAAARAPAPQALLSVAKLRSSGLNEFPFGIEPVAEVVAVGGAAREESS
jgi:hypothetical protein